MKRALIVLALALFSTTAFAQLVKLVEFEGGIGSQPFANVGGAVAANDVNGVPPGGRPWPIKKLKATVFTDGTIHAKGENLVLGGGATVGTRGGVTQVAATLFCGTGTGLLQFSSPAVPIAVNGDFEINAHLNAVPRSPCTNPVLLIRNAPPLAGTPGNWFAAGIPESDSDSD